MKHQPPKFSIVIPNLNGGNYLEEAILSVLSQDYPNFEIIVVDGGSSDHSIDIIKKHEQHIAYWISEPDCGQANAINKGIEKASGDLFDWLNSDDRIAAGAFWRVAKAFENNPDAYVVCGYMTYFSEGKYAAPLRMNVYLSLEETLVFGSMSGPSMYFRIEKFRETGPLDERLHFCFDMEFWYRFVEKFGLKHLSFVDKSLCDFRLHSQSKTVHQSIHFSEEEFIIQHTVVQSFAQKNKVVLSPKRLAITSKYNRTWAFPSINESYFAALAIQRHLDLWNEKLSIKTLITWYFRSFRLAPFYRNWRFYLLPMRIINWRLRLFPKRFLPI